MKRSSVLMLRNIVHGTTRSRSVPVSALASATTKTLTQSSRPTPIPSVSTHTPLDARSYSYYSLQENPMEEEWKRICKEYSDPEPEVVVDPPNLVTINSEEEFKAALSKAKDEALPVVFYYTSQSSAPCRVCLPLARALGNRIHEITTYKIDIGEEGVKGTLAEFNVTSVPHLNYFMNGKKVAELIGPDLKDLLETMRTLCCHYMDIAKACGFEIRQPPPTEEEEMPESTGDDSLADLSWDDFATKDRLLAKDPLFSKDSLFSKSPVGTNEPSK